MHRHMPVVGALSLAALISASSGAVAELALSANDGKAVLIDGVNTVPANPPPDSVTIIDLSASPPKVIAEIPVPASVVGPPSSVAIARKGEMPNEEGDPGVLAGARPQPACARQRTASGASRRRWRWPSNSRLSGKPLSVRMTRWPGPGDGVEWRC